MPERRDSDSDIVEDVIPLHQVRLSIRVPSQVREVVCVPQQQNLGHSQGGGRVEFTAPHVVGNQMVAVEFG